MCYKTGLKPYLISGNEFKSMFEIVAIFSVEDVKSPDQVFEAELQVVAATPTAAADQSFLVHFADLGTNDIKQYQFNVKKYVINPVYSQYFRKSLAN